MIYADLHYEKKKQQPYITFNLKILYARSFLIIELSLQILTTGKLLQTIGNFSFCILFLMANILRRPMENLFHTASHLRC